jgi:hypothetical protein
MVDQPAGWGQIEATGRGVVVTVRAGAAGDTVRVRVDEGKAV